MADHETLAQFTRRTINLSGRALQSAIENRLQDHFNNQCRRYPTTQNIGWACYRARNLRYSIRNVRRERARLAAA